MSLMRRRRGHLGLALATLTAVTPVTLALAWADANHAVPAPIVIATYVATVAALALTSRVARREGCELYGRTCAMLAVIALAMGLVEGAMVARSRVSVTYDEPARALHVADSWAGRTCGTGPYVLELPRNGRIERPTLTVDEIRERDATRALDLIWHDHVTLTVERPHGLTRALAEQAGLIDDDTPVIVTDATTTTTCTALVPTGTRPRTA